MDWQVAESQKRVKMEPEPLEPVNHEPVPEAHAAQKAAASPEAAARAMEEGLYGPIRRAPR